MEEYSKHRLYYLFSFVAVLWQIMDSAKLMANPLKRHFRIAYSWLSSHSFAKIKPFNKTYCLVKWQKIELFNYSFAIFKFIKSQQISIFRNGSDGLDRFYVKMSKFHVKCQLIK